MLPSETMIWQPEFTDKTLSRKPGAVQTIMVIFRRGKVALLNVITITFSRHYLQITYTLTTLTGVTYGTRL
ncbi:hypothetical protein EsCd1HHP024_01927 [Escherichia sp. HH091_1A]|nr:hypothetical protein EsCd1HHP024_01927 [Escherichia sp. HH091_1A]